MLLLRMSSAMTLPVLEMIATPLTPSNCQNWPSIRSRVSGSSSRSTLAAFLIGRASVRTGLALVPLGLGIGVDKNREVLVAVQPLQRPAAGRQVVEIRRVHPDRRHGGPEGEVGPEEIGLVVKIEGVEGNRGLAFESSQAIIISMVLLGAWKYQKLKHPATWVAVGINLFILLTEPLGRSAAVQEFLTKMIKG